MLKYLLERYLNWQPVRHMKVLEHSTAITVFILHQESRDSYFRSV
jgi:hypothetical protein